MSPAPTYYQATSEPFSARPRLAHDIDTGVCVVGGGFAGLWMARALLRRHYDVVLIEQDRVAHGASGKNGGFVSAGYNQGMSAIADRVGIDHARALYRLSRLGVELVREELALGLPGVNATPGHLRVSRIDDAEGLRRKADWYGQQFDHDMVFWPTERVREALSSDCYFQALHDADAFHIHPLNLAIALAEEIERRGGRIYEDTPALDADIDGVRKTVTTPRGKVRAHHVVFCGSALLGKTFPALSRTVFPVATYLAVTKPAGAKLADAIRYTGCISDDRRAFDYYRVIGDRLMWGGGISTDTRPPQNLSSQMKDRIDAVYPQLREVGIETAWSGLMGFAVHRMPQIGMLRPGAWIASAFGGQGLNTTAMAAELVASGIADKDDRWRLFIPFGLVWAGGALGRRIADFSYRAMKIMDRLDEARARQKAKKRKKLSGPAKAQAAV
jgi:gamma-glutamylputrescine oxidase